MKTKVTKMRKDTLANRFDKLHKVDKEIKALDKHLKEKGFRPKKEKKNFWGIKSTHEDKGKKAEFSLVIQDYTKGKSKDGAAIGQISIAAEGRTNVYTFDLIAPRGDFKKAKEYRVDAKLKVLEAESYWDCVWDQLSKADPLGYASIFVDCAAAAAFGGPFSWAVFLGCLGISFGATFGIACACCGCNCAWWCSWLGCCRQ